jgi:hypothetical protein
VIHKNQKQKYDCFWSETYTIICLKLQGCTALFLGINRYAAVISSFNNERLMDHIWRLTVLTLPFNIASSGKCNFTTTWWLL